MIIASPPPERAEVTVIEPSSRLPLLLLIGSGLAWLVLSGILALIASIQVHTPGFLSHWSFVSYGRMQAMQETAFVYGWIGNTGLGLTLWILRRLSGEPLRAPHWAVAGAVFWNLGLLLGLIGIGLRGATSLQFLQLPGAVLPLMLVAYAAIAISGVLAWTGRRRDLMFASHWYAVAALFLFPWLFSVAQAMLVWDPVRGTLQAVVAGWFAQSLWTLWMAPLALAGAYYVVPRMTGRLLPAYDTALLGFWALLFLGGLTGGRHLIGGPVPAWIATLAIVTSAMLLVHYIVVFLNLRGAVGGGGTSLRFIAFGLVAYVLGGLFDAIASLRAVAEVTQFTFIDQAQLQLAIYGGISLMLFGTLYFALPRITGRIWVSAGLVRGHLACTLLGVALLVVCLTGAGWVQGHQLNDAKVTFAEIGTQIHPWLVGASIAEAMLILGNLLLVVNFLRTAICPIVAQVRTAGLAFVS